MRIKVLSSAIDDLHAGKLFYENQGEGVGAYFFDSLFSDIDSLALYAGIHPIIHGYHRMLSKRFPYAVYYRSSFKECTTEPGVVADGSRLHFCPLRLESSSRATMPIRAG